MSPVQLWISAFPLSCLQTQSGSSTSLFVSQSHVDRICLALEQTRDGSRLSYRHHQIHDAFLTSRPVGHEVTPGSSAIKQYHVKTVTKPFLVRLG